MGVVLSQMRWKRRQIHLVHQRQTSWWVWFNWRIFHQLTFVCLATMSMIFVSFHSSPNIHFFGLNVVLLPTMQQIDCPISVAELQWSGYLRLTVDEDQGYDMLECW